jgi:hypothetical protein
LAVWTENKAQDLKRQGCCSCGRSKPRRAKHAGSWKSAHLNVVAALSIGSRLIYSTLSAFLGKKDLNEWSAKDIEELGEGTFCQRTVKHPNLVEALTLLVIQITEGKAGTV